MIKMAIVGNGFVGGAVDNGFTRAEKLIIDPKTHPKSNIKDIAEFEPDIIFVCVPTPMGIGGRFNDGILKGTLDNIKRLKGNAVTVVKSTVLPLHIKQQFDDHPRLVYNPEFLREDHAFTDFKNPSMRILGGDITDTTFVDYVYNTYSVCEGCPSHHTDVETAAWVKYTINTWLATKVLFFNQLKDNFSGDWDRFTGILKSDPRIGESHMEVPGPDGRKGFGGACFTKDASALSSYYDLPLLDKVLEMNTNIRMQYAEVSKREKDQNVVYETY